MAPRDCSIKDFKLGKELGRGGFASVYSAECLKPEFPKEVAVKIIDNKFIQRANIKDRVKNETKIHKRLDHANIVKCYTTFEDENSTYLVLELCKCTLEERLKNEGKKIVEVLAFEIIWQIVAGLHYLHCENIMHRDLSLRNILVTADNTIKITDFGLSGFFKTPSHHFFSIVGTHKFQSPEIRNYKPYDLKSECWSLGIVILAVLLGEVPSNNIEIPSTFSPEAKKLVSGLLQNNPEDRWSLEDVRESSFFKKYSKCYPLPIKGNEFSNSRTRNGSSRDSGMESIGTSFATTGKSSHRSQFDSDSDSIHKSTKRRNNHTISLLSTIHSSEHLDQSNPSKTRPTRDTNIHLRPLERDTKKIAAMQNTSVNRNLLKHTFPTLPSRHTPVIETLPHESIEYTEYPNALCKRQNFHDPFHPPANSDKRERSASEEQRKQYEIKKSYSGEAERSSLHSRDKMKKSQMKSSEKYSKHSSSNRECFSPSRSKVQAENIGSKSCQPKHSNLEEDSLTKNNLQMGRAHQKPTQKPLPLTTERLRACRYAMKKIAVVSILENGEVCVEWLKPKKEKQYVSVVVFISSNGKWIDVFKPHNCLVGNTPPPKPNNNKKIKSFPYDDLDPNYWKMYRKAKVLVDYVRATTPRITYYDKDSKCVMMENFPDPNFEMEFFDGGHITKKSTEISITDERGQTISVTESDKPDKHFAVMLDKFRKMEKWCKNMDAQLEAMKSNDKTETLPYPIMFGNPPLAKKCSSTREYLKENIAFHSSGDPAISKNKNSHNSYEKHKRTPSNSSYKCKLNSQSTH